MKIEECYVRMGGDYDDVLRRLGNEERVRRFLSRFVEEESYSDLCRFLESGAIEEAFRAAHSLKGICMNLGLFTLYLSVKDLTEELRGGVFRPETQALFEQVSIDYRKTIACIQEYLQI